MDRKEEILNPASKAFDKYGLLKTKLEDIAKECGIKKTALYYYFKSKAEIIQTMFLRDIEKLKSLGISKINKKNLQLKSWKLTFMYVRNRLDI